MSVPSCSKIVSGFAMVKLPFIRQLKELKSEICKRLTLPDEPKILVPAQNTSEIAKYFQLKQGPMQK